MGMLSIKIRIGEREYPMKVDENEEETIRNAARILNDKIKMFKEKYSVEDKIDILSMVAYDSILTQLKNQLEQNKETLIVQDKLQYLTSLISKAI